MTDKLYNEKLKQAYIDSCLVEDGTKNNILFELQKSAKVEKQYNKDLYAFNDKEIDELLYYLKRDNIMSVHKSISIYKDYINWCIRRGQRGIYENGENRMSIIQKTEDISKYVSNRKVKNKFLSEEEFYNIINNLYNEIDKAFILSIYHFIAGEKLHELRSLKIGDIDEKNKKVRLVDLDGNIRYSNISTKLIELLKEANEQEVYIQNNGMMNASTKRGHVKLNQSDYIFRNVYRKGNEGEMALYSGISRKIIYIKKYTGYNLVTINSLKDTRILHEIAKVAKEVDKNVSQDEIYRIAIDNIKKYYDITFTDTQLYNIKRKYEQVVKLKDLR